MGQLFQVRGPNNYRSPLARALLHGFSQLSVRHSDLPAPIFWFAHDLRR